MGWAWLGSRVLLRTGIERVGGLSCYDFQLRSHVARGETVPVVASGGAGYSVDVAEALTLGRADAALLAGVLHDGTTDVTTIKTALRAAGIPVSIAA